jgi:TolB protein
MRTNLMMAGLLAGAMIMGSLAASATTRGDGAILFPIAGITGSAQNPCWNPTETQLIFTNFETRYNVGNAVVRTAAIPSGKLDLALSPAQNQSVNLPGQCQSASLHLVALSSDVPGPDEIYVAPTAGGSIRRVTNRGGALAWEPSLSPKLADGSTWITFESHTNGNSPGEIWKVNVNGTGLVRLTSGHDDRQPQWSPQGDRILFQRYFPGPGTWDVYTMLTDGSTLVNVTNDPSTDDTDPSWSPSGKWIVYSSDSPDIAIANLFVIPSAGGKRVQVTHYVGYDGAPGWSPDGNWIAFESAPSDPDNSGNSKIWAIRAPNGIR